MAYFVYAMYAGDFVKIGVTSSLDRRINQVQTGTPMLIHRVKYKNVFSRSVALSEEKMLHDFFKEKRTYGEWFYNHINSTRKFKDFFNGSETITRGQLQTDESPRKIFELHKINKIDDPEKRLEKLSIMRLNILETYEEKFIYKDKQYILSLVDESINSDILSILKEEDEIPTINRIDKYENMSVDEHIKYMKNKFKIEKENKHKTDRRKI